MSDINCVRCGQTREQQAFPPFPNATGQRVFREICAVCWAEWLKLQQQLINHYALNLREPGAREFLLQQMDQFLFTSAPQA
ncbi:MAG TPA: oxidative damage protection protein [Gemmatimonadales bacterium]|nr:oxidative damage protection protein [Gemmatimonadales bacterium]